MKKFFVTFFLFVLAFFCIPKTSLGQVCAQVLQPGCQFKVLVFDLQPAGTASNLENNNLAFVNGMNSLGYNFTHAKRATTPTITLSLLQQYNLVYLWNGCGGATGLFSQAEINAIRDYYLGGGHLIIVADDANGDSSSLGNCYDRVNQLTVNLGAYFTGFYMMPEFVCHSLYKPPSSDTTLLNGITQSKFFSPSQLVFTGNVSWSNTLPQISAQYVDATNFGSTTFNAMGYIPKNSSHGLVVFSAEREFLVGNQANCAGQSSLTFWNNLIGANQVCVTPTITPTATPTPISTATPALLGTCNSIRVLYSPSDNPTRPPMTTDPLQLECGSIAGATRYEFQGRPTTSATFTIFPAPISTGARLSAPFNLPQSGEYTFQCRGCADTTPASCQPWQ